MNFESRQKRQFWINFGISFIPDAVIALAITFFFIRDDNYIYNFIFIFALLQIFYLARWTIYSLFNYFQFKLVSKSTCTKQLKSYLINNKFPEPKDNEESPENYFLSITNNDELSFELRMKAYKEYQYFRYMYDQYQLQNALRSQVLWEDAIQEYKN
jgi:hypothetical protein